MSRTTRIIVIVVAVFLLAGIAAAAYIYVSGGSGEPSTVLAAPTLAPQAADVGDPEANAADDRQLFEIVPEESEVRFLLNEELRGQPMRVVGRTDQVAGQILVDFDQPARSEVGTIRINLRTVVTDQEMRNRAIRSQILQTSRDEFEFSEFVPAAVEGLPDSITLGEQFDFAITGDLTVRDITNPVTFNVSVTPVSEERLEGTATAQVLRSDYNLVIPSVPSVANVSEEVDLEIDFTAQPAGAVGG